jgi:hypothetical protein
MATCTTLKLLQVLKSSAYVMSHGCFIFSRLLFRDEFINFLHVLLSCNISIYFSLISFEINFNYVKSKISVLLPLNSLSAILLFFLFKI